MAWLESHQELGAHPKTRKFAHVLGINKVQAVGHLHYLWWWAMDYCDSGDLSKFEALDIAIGAEWDGDADVFLDALTRAGFVDACDGMLVIHDWPEYTGRLIERRRQDAERKRQYRAVQSPSTGRDADVRETAYVTQPNTTQPNPTEPNRTEPEDEKAAQTDEPSPAAPSRASPNLPFEALLALCDATGANVGELSAAVKSKQLGKAKQLLGAGMTVDEIGRCAGYLASESWRTGTVDMFTVEKERGKWELAGKPAEAKSRASPNGSTKPIEPKVAPKPAYHLVHDGERI